MAKRKKPKGKGKRPAMTRRDVEAKRAKRDDAGSDEVDASDAERDGDPRDDGAPEADARSADADDEAADESSESADEGAADSEPKAGAAAKVGRLEGADWALFLVRLEQKWTWLETRVLFVALMVLTVVLCVWIVLRGLKDPLEAQTAAGTVFRAFAGATILGGLARLLTRGRLEEKRRDTATLIAVIVGVATAKLWRGVGIEYASGWLDWLQEGSALTLMGGLKGISTRLTMTVALIGASLAAASGSHINIDVILRVIPERLRNPVNILGGLATAIICIATSWGLLDHIAIAEYDVDRDRSASEKVGVIVDDLGEQFFLWRKQARLDLGALPRVITGRKWNEDAMTGREWNEFLDNGGFVERYGEEKVAPLRAGEEDLDGSRTPFVVSPIGDARNALMRSMDLIFPFGFLMMGLRFILRALLIFSGHIKPHFEGESGDDDREPDGSRDDADGEERAEGEVA